MDLQISVVLLFILFTEGYSLSCYQCVSQMGSCPDQKVIQTCDSGSRCMSLTSVTQIGDTAATVKVKSCAFPNDCKIWSLNFSSSKISSSCCDTDLCNGQDPPESSSNGKKCYYCDGKSCSNILSCTGSEDRCLKATGSFGGKSVVLKGCVSKAICNATTSVPDVQSISCCDGNLCNGALSDNLSPSSANSVTQSFLFLCCSLLSFILLH